jgi:hypothetical protein
VHCCSLDVSICHHLKPGQHMRAQNHPDCTGDKFHGYGCSHALRLLPPTCPSPARDSITLWGYIKRSSQGDDCCLTCIAAALFQAAKARNLTDRLLWQFANMTCLATRSTVNNDPSLEFSDQEPHRHRYCCCTTAVPQGVNNQMTYLCVFINDNFTL